MLEITAKGSEVRIEGEASVIQVLETYSCITHSVYTVLQGSGIPEEVAVGLVAGAAAIGTNDEVVQPQLSIKAIVPAKNDG